MRKLAVFAVAAVVAMSGLASAVEAKSNRGGGPVWRTNDRKASNAASRQDGNRAPDARKDKDRKRDKVIWRTRKGKHVRPYFLFRGRGDCEYVRVRQADGSLSQKVWRVCN